MRAIAPVLTTTRQIADEALYRSRGSDTPGDNIVVQNDFWVDAVHGNNNNPGTQAKPVKTFAELTERFGLYNTVTPKTGSQITIHLLSDIPVTDPFRLHTILGTGVILVVQGGVKSVIRSGVLTAVTAMDNGPANQPFEITAAVPALFWQNHRTFRVTITSGVGIGSQAWVLKDLGAGKARMSTWMADVPGQPGLQTPSTPPAPGDHFHVEQLFGMTIASDDDVRSETVGSGVIFAVGTESFIDIELQPPGLSIFGSNIEVDVGNPTSSIGFSKSRIVPLTFDREVTNGFNSGSQWINCCFLDGQVTHGRALIGGASVLGTTPLAQNAFGPALSMQGNTLVVAADYIFQGDQANFVDAHLSIEEGRFFPETIAVFDSFETITMTDATAVVRFASFTFGGNQKFWGSGNQAPVFLFRGTTFSFQQVENSPPVVSPPGGPPTINVPTIQNTSGVDWVGGTDGLNSTNTSFFFDNPTGTFKPPGGIASLWTNLAVAQPAGFATIAGPIPNPPGNDFFYGASAVDPSNQDILQWQESTHVPP
jgi:hypothetical protein